MFPHLSLSLSIREDVKRNGGRGRGDKPNKTNRQNNDLFKVPKREVSQILIFGVGKTEVNQTESKRNIKVENYSVPATV